MSSGVTGEWKNGAGMVYFVPSQLDLCDFGTAKLINGLPITRTRIDYQMRHFYALLLLKLQIGLAKHLFSIVHYSHYLPIYFKYAAPNRNQLYVSLYKIEHKERILAIIARKAWQQLKLAQKTKNRGCVCVTGMAVLWHVVSSSRVPTV